MGTEQRKNKRRFWVGDRALLQDHSLEVVGMAWLVKVEEAELIPSQVRFVWSGRVAVAFRH